MKSSLRNMVLTLLGITLIAAALLAVVYSVTLDPIEAARSAKTSDALSRVIPEFDNDPTTDTMSMVVRDTPVKIYTGRSGGKITGYAIESVSKNGFSGEIKIITGFLPDGEIYNIESLLHNETPGLGSKMADPDNVLVLSFQGNNPANLRMSVTKDGGDIDAITASTITSRAYVEAVQTAYEAFRAVVFGEEPVEDHADPFKLVLPDFDNELDEQYTQLADGTRLHIAYLGGELVGYAVKGKTDRGYDGDIELLVGILPDGTVHGITVIEQSETPGFGAQIKDEDNPLALSFIGQTPSEMKMKITSEGGDIEAISGSTITSEAYIDAVADAYRRYVEFINDIR